MERDDLLPQTLDDDAAWMAYADWLQSRGEPQGELIALDVALEAATGTQREALAVARKELVTKYGAAILGETFARFLASGYGVVTWQRGYIVEFEYAGSRMISHKRAVGWLVKLIVEKPEPFRFVQSLAFPLTDVGDLALFAKFAHLERLDVSGSNVRALAPLVGLKKLVEVNVDGCEIGRDQLKAFKEARPDVRLLTR